MRVSPRAATLSPMPSRFAKSRRCPSVSIELALRDRYVTDGRKLFRVVSRFSPRAGSGAALLEDCATLEVTPYSPEELYAMALRPVFPTVSGR